MDKKDCIKLLSAQADASKFDALRDDAQLIIVVRRPEEKPPIRYGLFALYFRDDSSRLYKLLLGAYDNPYEAEVERSSLDRTFSKFPRMVNRPALKIEEI